MKDFASEARPLRASALYRVVQCPLSAMLHATTDEEDTPGPAADTGSAVHRAAYEFHRGKGVTEAVKAMRDLVNAYPFADLDAAEQHFRAYAADGRNKEEEVILCEEAITLTLPPSPHDPTQAPVILRGTLDQVRRDARGGFAVADIKTGKRLDGAAMLAHHALQLACYQAGAAVKLGQPVHRAFIIRTADYIRPRGGKVGPVWYEAPWSLRDLDTLLLSVRDAVADIRMGRVYPCPGDVCTFCVAGNVGNCVRRIPK